MTEKPVPLLINFLPATNFSSPNGCHRMPLWPSAQFVVWVDWWGAKTQHRSMTVSQRGLYFPKFVRPGIPAQKWGWGLIPALLYS